MSAPLAVFCPIRDGTEGVTGRMKESLDRNLPGAKLFTWIEGVEGRMANVSIDVAFELFFGKAKEAGAEWAMLMFPSDQWPSDEHVSVRVSRNLNSMGFQRPSGRALESRSLTEVLASLPQEIEVCALSILGCEDAAGERCQAQLLETRIVRVSKGDFRPAAEPAHDRTMHLPQFPVLFQPLSAWHLENDRLSDAMKVAKSAGGMMDRRVYLRARTERDTREALKAFDVLFRHYSTYEELAALDEVMKNLPYTFEGRPELREWERLLDVQIGPLKDPKDKSKWDEVGFYAHRAPVQSTTDVTTFGSVKGDVLPQQRSIWLGQEVATRGFKRVIEVGASDGVNLVYLAKALPAVDWTGIDVSGACAATGEQLSKIVGGFKILLVPELRAPKGAQLYDAAFCFEVLEHNHEPHSVLDAVESWVRPGGRVFLTTPCGAWSLHNDATYVVELHKEHIRAYTVDRTRKMLKDRGAQDIEVQRVENGSPAENNAWVFSSYIPATKG